MFCFILLILPFLLLYPLLLSLLHSYSLSVFSILILSSFISTSRMDLLTSVSRCDAEPGFLWLLLEKRVCVVCVLHLLVGLAVVWTMFGRI